MMREPFVKFYQCGDCYYCVKYTQEYSHSINFDVYKLMNFGDKFSYQDQDNHPQDKIEDAYSFLRGGIKWDGCTNYIFNDAKENMMEHACTKEELIGIGLLLGRIHDQCSKVMQDQKVLLDGHRVNIVIIEDKMPWTGCK